MNAENFMDLLNTLPDDMIVSAVHAKYQRRALPVWLMPAAAACLIIGIAAAVYPKLRIQKPPVIEPAVSVTETTGTQMTTDIRTLTDAPETKPTAHTESAVTAGSTAAEAEIKHTETVPPDSQPVTQQTAAEIQDIPDRTQQTETHTETEPPVLTTAPTTPTETISETRTVIQIEAPEAVPVWQGEEMRPESASDPMSAPQIRCRFRLTAPDTDMDSGIRRQYGIPADFDLTKTQCLLIQVETEYADTAVTGGTLSADGLVLHVACRNQKTPLTDICYTVPLPEGITVEPENCRAEYQIYEDDTGKPQIDQPMIQIHE